jgi:hypothetical protein
MLKALSSTSKDGALPVCDQDLKNLRASGLTDATIHPIPSEYLMWVLLSRTVSPLSPRSGRQYRSDAGA